MELLAVSLGLFGTYLLTLKHKYDVEGWGCLVISTLFYTFINFNAGLMWMGIGSIIYTVLEVRCYLNARKRRDNVSVD